MSDSIVTSAAGWLATYLVHSTLLLLAAAALARRLRDPAARERLWKAALVAPLLTASATLALPGQLRPVLDVGSRVQATGSGAANASADAVPFAAPDAGPDSPGSSMSGSANAKSALLSASELGDARPDPALSAPPSAGAASASGWRSFLPSARAGSVAVVALWLLGTGLLLLSRALAVRRLHARLASRDELSAGVPHALLVELCGAAPPAARPRLTLSDELSTPVVLGRREICLPRRVVDELPERELAAILAHELAHIHRGDLGWLRLCGLLECVLFMQPLNRMARRRLFDAVELLCDDWAGERTGSRLELASGLATVARWTRAPAEPLPLPCLGGERAPLLERVERLLAEPACGRRPVAITAALAGLALLLACCGPAVRVEPSTAAAAEAPAAPPDFEALDLDELELVTQQVGARAAERLLALPDDWRQRYATELAVPGTTAVRILQRGRHELPPKRGGGAYYSFATDDHDYNRAKLDLQYAEDQLSTSFYGGTTGHVLDLGATPLAAVRPDAPPPGLDPAVAQTYAAMASFTPGEANLASAFREALKLSRLESAPAVAGHSYLLRAILPDEHDHLVAFRVQDVSPESVVLVGRVIKSWPVAPEHQRQSVPMAWSTEGAGDWLFQLDDPSLFALQEQLARRLEERLVAVPAGTRAEHPGLVAPDGGLARLYPRGRYAFEGVLPRGGLAYFSFATGSHSYDQEPDLSWQDDQFNTGFFGGNSGAFLDLGAVELDAVEAAAPPAGLSPQQRALWDELLAPTLQDDLGPLDRAPVVAGHTYLLRSVVQDEHDLLAAFRPVEQDEQGMTIAWRVLQRYAD